MGRDLSEEKKIGQDAFPFSKWMKKLIKGMNEVTDLRGSSFPAERWKRDD